jgi:phosphatidylglycerophosphate synthase
MRAAMGVARTFPRHAGDVLTALRLAGTPLFVALVWRAPHHAGAGWLAAGVFYAIAASDFFDGRLARRAGETSAIGRVLDHGADILFILSALTSYVTLGVVPWWVPAAIAASFVTYVYDSARGNAAAAPQLRPSRIGHLGGWLNYVLVGVVVCNESTGLRVLPQPLLTVLYALVPLYSGAAIAERVRRRLAR